MSPPRLHVSSDSLLYLWVPIPPVKWSFQRVFQQLLGYDHHCSSIVSNSSLLSICSLFSPKTVPLFRLLPLEESQQFDHLCPCEAFWISPSFHLPYATEHIYVLHNWLGLSAISIRLNPVEQQPFEIFMMSDTPITDPIQARVQARTGMSGEEWLNENHFRRWQEDRDGPSLDRYIHEVREETVDGTGFLGWRWKSPEAIKEHVQEKIAEHTSGVPCNDDSIHGNPYQ